MTLRIAVNRSQSILVDPAYSHNRWHPDIEPVAEIAPGEEVIVELRDGMDGALARGVDLRTLDLDANHPLTGPIFVRGAEPGDVLEIETLEIEPSRRGATALIPGFGLLGDRFAEPVLVCWEIRDGVARSPDLPGVAIRGAPFLGSIGVAPSHELLERASRREAAVSERGGLALAPQAKGAVPAGGPPAWQGLRTIPPRENGGNLDIPQLTVGSRLLLEVHVEGALLSAGDAHFAQGEGESCGTAIEITALARLRVGLRKAADTPWVPRFPAYEFHAPPGTPGGRAYLATTGIPLHDNGENGSMDLTLAARRALDELIGLLCATRGLSPEQACVLASVAADLRISQAVNVPNGLVSAILPLDVFEE